MDFLSKKPANSPSCASNAAGIEVSQKVLYGSRCVIAKPSLIVSATRRWVLVPATTISLLTVPTLTSFHVHSAAIISYLDAFLKHNSRLRFHCQSLEKDLKSVFTASAIS